MAMTRDPPPSGSNSPADSAKPEPPLFSARATTLFRGALIGAFVLATGSAFLASAYYHSASWYGVGFAPVQPVPFSHRKHAGDLRIDCRNCHATVETSAFAGMPSTETCLACHSQLMTNAPALKPVMESDAHRVPLQWNRVTRLPDYVYFDHSIHVSKGVGCATCHGNVGTMAITTQRKPLTMRWCLDCHRNPGPRLVPPSEIFAATAPRHQPPGPQVELMRFYHIHTENLTNCSTCHR
jgi:hypothetical protein